MLDCTTPHDPNDINGFTIERFTIGTHTAPSQTHNDFVALSDQVLYTHVQIRAVGTRRRYDMGKPIRCARLVDGITSKKREMIST
jgi:hypothetical protein